MHGPGISLMWKVWTTFGLSPTYSMTSTFWSEITFVVVKDPPSFEAHLLAKDGVRSLRIMTSLSVLYGWKLLFLLYWYSCLAWCSNSLCRTVWRTCSLLFTRCALGCRIFSWLRDHIWGFHSTCMNAGLHGGFHGGNAVCELAYLDESLDLFGCFLFCWVWDSLNWCCWWHHEILHLSCRGK